MRGYPVDFPAVLDTLTCFLYPEPRRIMRMSYADLSSPGTFRSNNSYTIKYGKTNPYYYKGKVAVLLNGIRCKSQQGHTVGVRKKTFIKIKNQ